MSEKDFLSKIANEAKKPDSFKEEERVKIQKEKKPIKPLMIIIPIIVLILLAGLGWFFFLRPTIEVPNFVGKTQKEVAQWVTQQGIEKNGIIFNQEYSLEYDDGQIMSQSIEAGKKVKKDVKLDFVMSKGADPDEKIEVPDIKNMTKDELNTWVQKNKLAKTKIMTSYSEEVEKDAVISFEFKGCQSDEFTRGCTLNISVSKGPQPAGTITVEDFKGKMYEEAEAWAKSKKVVSEKVEVFSNDIAQGMIVSQSIAKGKTMKEKEVITFTVSKGKGIKVPNFNTMANKEVDAWLNENANLVSVTKKYSKKTGYVLSQSVSSGNMIGGEDKLEIVLNLGNTFYTDDPDVQIGEIVGMKYDKLVDKLNNIRYLGIDAYTGQWGANTEVYSDKPKGTILSVECSGYSDGKIYPCDGKLPLDARFSVVVSKGKTWTGINLSGAKADSDEYTFITNKLVTILSNEKIYFQNSATGDYCKLTINGQAVKNTSAINVTEGDNVILEYVSGSLPESETAPAETPPTPTGDTKLPQ